MDSDKPGDGARRFSSDGRDDCADRASFRTDLGRLAPRCGRLAGVDSEILSLSCGGVGTRHMGRFLIAGGSISFGELGLEVIVPVDTIAGL